MYHVSLAASLAMAVPGRLPAVPGRLTAVPGRLPVPGGLPVANGGQRLDCRPLRGVLVP